MSLLTKILIIFLCAQTGLSNSVMQEVFSFPFLVKHYFVHSENNSIKITEFLRLHYTNNKHQKENYSKHNHDSLPFHHQVSLGSYAFCTANLLRFEENEKVYYKSHISNFKYSFSAKEGYLKFFWNPPKFI